ncbi:MAG: hypothetical protein R3D27_14785 [Hyphomicrobiaceae bacterium]
MILGTIRVIFGFVLACLAAGAVKVAFAVTPAELAQASPDRLWQAGEWALLAATETAVFAAPFALIAVLLAEWLGIRTFAYHGIIGILIAAAGFAVLISGQSPETAGLANSYAIAAFLSTGLVAGVVYWLFSGRLSGGRRITRRRIAEHAARNAGGEMTSDRSVARPAATATQPSAPQPGAATSVPNVAKPAKPGGETAAKPAV